MGKLGLRVVLVMAFATSEAHADEASRLVVHVEAGGGLRWLAGHRLVSGEVAGGIGGRFHRVRIYAGLRLLGGDLEGLDAYAAQTGPTVDYALTEHIWLGGGITLGGILIRRQTESAPFAAFLLGTNAHVAYDFVRVDRLVLDARIGIALDGAMKFLSAPDRQNHVPIATLVGPTFAIGGTL